MAGKKKSGGSRNKGGSKGVIGAITAFISICVVTALVVGFLRSTGMTDSQSVMNEAKNSVNPMQAFANNVYGKFEYFLNCNLLKNSACASKPSGGLQDPGDAPAPSHGNLEDMFNKNNEKGNHPSNGSIGNTDSSNGSANNADNNAGNDDSRSALEQKLDQVTIADAKKTDYSRADYPHWIIQSGKCDTREIVLANAGFASNARTCKAEPKNGFTFTEPYTGKQVTDPHKLDIDHVIPLAYADSHGAHDWDTARKQAFANDLTQLVASDASANRKKGDKGPADWMPSNKSYTCEYSTKWIDTALKYNISITNSDKNALKTGIRSCQ